MNTPIKSFADVSIAVLPPVARFNLRIAPANLATATAAFGLPLPGRIGQGAAKGDRTAWCLGPDEWLLHAPEAEQAAIVADFAKAGATMPHSLTVISDREFTIAITGPSAQEFLTVACPLDLSRMAPGTAKRTLLDSAQVVLIRDAEDAFRIEVWRSFFPHVSELLDIAQREFACGL
jgi:sarcosine oxidase, subunit gamma